jgi:hypothetical protein
VGVRPPPPGTKQTKDLRKIKETITVSFSDQVHVGLSVFSLDREPGPYATTAPLVDLFSLFSAYASPCPTARYLEE